jgi:glycosyltransferase involved in cell wall biosynthesis
MTVVPLASVVIAARNEEAVLGDCLTPLAGAAADGTLEIVVVCNGCTDATASVARSFAGVRVLELPAEGKAAALRAGERAVSALPRLYLDADVVLPLAAALAVARRLCGSRNGHRPLAARPPARYDASGSGPLVRRYYRARGRIPAVLGSLWGAGVYGLSAPGRARFTEFPDLIADDLWIDQLFQPDEIEIVDCPPVTVTAPRHTRDLLAVLRRSYRGKAEHHTAHPDTARDTAPDTARDVGRLARSGPGGFVDAATYTGLVVAARVANGVSTVGRQSWERDDSSRRRR